MNSETFAQLRTAPGQQALQAAHALQPAEPDFLTHFTRLQKSHPRELARAALETVLLRDKARTKFSRAGAMYFTRAA